MIWCMTYKYWISWGWKIAVLALSNNHSLFIFIFIIIGATSNDIIAPSMCQVSEMYSKRSDLISSAKVEVGSLAFVDFCRIFGSSWFQSFNVFWYKAVFKSISTSMWDLKLLIVSFTLFPLVLVDVWDGDVCISIESFMQ